MVLDQNPANRFLMLLRDQAGDTSGYYQTEYPDIRVLNLDTGENMYQQLTNLLFNATKHFRSEASPDFDDVATKVITAYASTDPAERDAIKSDLFTLILQASTRLSQFGKTKAGIENRDSLKSLSFISLMHFYYSISPQLMRNLEIIQSYFNYPMLLNVHLLGPWNEVMNVLEATWNIVQAEDFKTFLQLNATSAERENGVTPQSRMSRLDIGTGMKQRRGFVVACLRFYRDYPSFANTLYSKTKLQNWFDSLKKSYGSNYANPEQAGDNQWLRDYRQNFNVISELLNIAGSDREMFDIPGQAFIKRSFDDASEASRQMVATELEQQNARIIKAKQEWLQQIQNYNKLIHSKFRMVNNPSLIESMDSYMLQSKDTAARPALFALKLANFLEEYREELYRLLHPGQTVDTVAIQGFLEQDMTKANDNVDQSACPNDKPVNCSWGGCIVPENFNPNLVDKNAPNRVFAMPGCTESEEAYVAAVQAIPARSDPSVEAEVSKYIVDPENNKLRSYVKPQRECLPVFDVDTEKHNPNALGQICDQVNDDYTSSLRQIKDLKAKMNDLAPSLMSDDNGAFDRQTEFIKAMEDMNILLHKLRIKSGHSTADLKEAESVPAKLQQDRQKLQMIREQANLNGVDLDDLSGENGLRVAEIDGMNEPLDYDIIKQQFFMFQRDKVQENMDKLEEKLMKLVNMVPQKNMLLKNEITILSSRKYIKDFSSMQKRVMSLKTKAEKTNNQKDIDSYLKQLYKWDMYRKKLKLPNLVGLPDSDTIKNDFIRANPEFAEFEDLSNQNLDLTEIELNEDPLSIATYDKILKKVRLQELNIEFSIDTEDARQTMKHFLNRIRRPVHATNNRRKNLESKDKSSNLNGEEKRELGELRKYPALQELVNAYLS
jgi:hypothetical protein